MITSADPLSRSNQMNQDDGEATPLHTMQPLSRFSNRAADYAQYRPSYPKAAIDAILENLGEPSQLVAADMGAGTGISSRLLAERGVQVLALEPNLAMRQAAQPHPRVVLRDGTAEQTALPTASIDLVTCFQSFHWFEPQSALAEFRRILKRSRRLALVWNDRNQQDEFQQSYNRLVRQVSNNHPAERRLIAVNPLFSSPHFAKVQRFVLAYKQAVDLPGLIGRATSTSYIPQEGPAYEQLISGLQELHARFKDSHGLVELVYNTSVYLAEPHA